MTAYVAQTTKADHPGEILEQEFLKPLGLSQKAFAGHLGGSWSQPKLSAIIHGRRGITEVIALDFADALGTTPEFWLNLQAQYDLWDASHSSKSGDTRLSGRS